MRKGKLEFKATFLELEILNAMRDYNFSTPGEIAIYLDKEKSRSNVSKAIKHLTTAGKIKLNPAFYEVLE